ncbi:DNA polymerase [Leptolyngbya sp. AN03gr2]|uniref:DNA polymerase n=1 Tax=unclassified Leptolyngbya TaxID=2650499 RepID=UPI003D311BC1
MIKIEELSAYPASPYDYIDTGEKLKTAIQTAATTNKFGINIETTGPDPHRDRIRLIQIAVPNQSVLVIDLFQIPQAEWNPLKSLLQGNALKIGHTLKTERKFLVAAQLGFKGPYFDTEIAYRLILAGRNRKTTLQTIVAIFLRFQFSQEQASGNFHGLLSQNQMQHAANKADASLKLEPHLEERLNQNNSRQWNIAHNIEFPCIAVTASLELSGIQFDLKSWLKAAQQFDETRTQAWKLVKQLRRSNINQMSLLPEFTDTVNPNSHTQLLAALQDLGIPITTTSGKSLAPFAQDYPVVQAVLEHQQLSKLNPFGESYPTYIHPKTGRIHADWLQIGTKTGRLTCKNPPLQTIPRDRCLRECFVARSGYKIIKADYSQIELRILARICQDQPLISAFQKGQDVHALTAAVVFHKSSSQISAEERRIGKIINFGIIYRMSSKRLKQTLEDKAHYFISQRDAEQFINDFYEKHPAIKQWQTTICHPLRRKTRYIGQTLAGRLRYWEWEDKPPVTEIINYPVQGLNADIYKEAAHQFLSQQADQNLTAEFILMIHDELVLECPADQANIICKILHACMLKAAKQWLEPIPVVIDIQIGNSWK